MILNLPRPVLDELSRVLNAVMSMGLNGSEFGDLPYREKHPLLVDQWLKYQQAVNRVMEHKETVRVCQGPLESSAAKVLEDDLLLIAQGLGILIPVICSGGRHNQAEAMSRVAILLNRAAWRLSSFRVAGS